MRNLKSVKQAQRFLNTHASVYNVFNLRRHLVSEGIYRYFGLRSTASWKKCSDDLAANLDEIIGLGKLTWRYPPKSLTV